MPRPALTAEEIEAYRKRTVDTATRLFAQRGYEGVTMRTLAAELGHSPMTPYRYFSNKEEIFAAVRAEAFRRFADQQLAAYEKADDPIQRLLAMREAYFDFALEHPHSYRVMFQMDQAPPDKYPDVATQAGRSFDTFLKAVTAAIDSGFLDGDPLTIAHLLWANVHGLVSLHLAGRLTVGRTLEELRKTPGLIALRTPQ